MRFGSFVPLLAALLLSVLARRAAERPEPPLAEVHVPLPSAYVRVAALAFDEVVADFLWIRFLQNIPLRPAEPALGRSLAAQLHAITELDPQFRVAHLQGSILLSVLGNQQCAAFEIARRGAERFPEDWRLAFQAGYICLDELADSACAARYMQAAAADPGAPSWLPGLVARLLAESSQIDAAIDFLTQRVSLETDPRLREQFEDRLRQAIHTRHLTRLDESIRAWQLAHGEPPTLDDLLEAGLAGDLPATDPFGGAYYVGPDGRARTTSGHTGLRAFRREDGYRGTTAEKITVERVIGRMPSVADEPLLVQARLDRLRAAARDPLGAAAALELLRRLAPEQEEDLRVLQARLLITSEVEQLRAAHLRLLQRDPLRAWAIAEIADAAGVPMHDPFGDAYRFDERGMVVSDKGREPLVAVGSDRGQGASACR